MEYNMSEDNFEPMDLLVEVTPKELEKSGKTLEQMKQEYQDKYPNYNIVIKIVSGLKKIDGR